MMIFETIRTTLGSRPPSLLPHDGRRRAAVALILRPAGDTVEVLFIRRSHHGADPWSGNLAFPGGKIDRTDGDARAAAERETLEEIGLDLKHADCLGRLDDITGAYLPVLVSCFVYGLKTTADLTLNHEVSDAFWCPVADLQNPTAHHLAEIEWNGMRRKVQAIDLLGTGGPVLWGITYRLVMQFLERLRLFPET